MAEDLPNLTVQQLEYLTAALAAPTWADAAGELGVSPSALSQGVAELERRVGVPLFERSGRRRVLRPQAEPVATYAAEVVARTRDLARWAEQVSHGRTGSLRVGMIDVAAVAHFPAALRALRDERPDVELHLAVAPSGELLDLLVAGSLDLVVCVAPPHGRAAVRTEVLLDEPLRAYAPPGTRVGPVTGWGPWVTFAGGSHTRHLVQRALVDAGGTFEVVAESNQPDVLVEMVRLGLGWTVLPVAQAEAGPRSLTPVRTAPVATRRLVSARRDGSRDDPLVEDLLARLRAVVTG